MASQHLQPPPAVSYHRRVAPPGMSSTSTSAPGPATTLSVHSTATVAETAIAQGPFPISVGEGTIIHPRARIFTFAGPVRIGRKCIIGEKCVIGSPPPLVSLDARGTGTNTGRDKSTASTGEREAVTIADSVVISPLSVIYPGVTVGEAAVVDTLATIGCGARIGAHTKVCAGCTIPEGVSVADWITVWGSAERLERRRRKKMSDASNALDARTVETSRLTVLSVERNVLSRLLIPIGSSRKR